WRLVLTPPNDSYEKPPPILTRWSGPAGVNDQVTNDSARRLTRSWLLKYEPELTSGASTIGSVPWLGSIVASNCFTLTRASTTPLPVMICSDALASTLWLLMSEVTGCGLNVLSPA